MPGVSPGSPECSSDSLVTSDSLIPYKPEPIPATPYRFRHGLKPPLCNLSVSWCRGTYLRVVLIRPPDKEGDPGGEVVEFKLWNNDENGDEDESKWRKIVYGSVSPFALLQSRKNSVAGLSKMHSVAPSPYHLDWWEYVMEYSKDIGSLLDNPKGVQGSVLKDPKDILQKGETPTSLKAAWELLEMFYVDKLSKTWLSEQLVDWLERYDCVLSSFHSTVYLKLMDFQKRVVTIQAVEDDPRYWDLLSSLLAIGWLDIVVKLLRLHGSYQLDQLSSRETENGLVEAVSVLISKMPRMRSSLEVGKLGECFKAKADFVKAWERWRAQISKLDSSAFWLQCNHHQTQDGLKRLLQIMLGNGDILSTVTCHWIELYISYLKYIRPFTVGLENMYNLACKCMKLKPPSKPHKLMRLLNGILSESIEVVVAECSRAFGSWMAAHAIELLTVENDQAEDVLHEEHVNLGGICIEELHRLVYANVLASDVLTWQTAPIYLAACMKHGMGVLEILFCRQSPRNTRSLQKSLEICRLYNLESTSLNMMKITGVNEWKHGRKGAGLYWLQEAKDEVRLHRIAMKLFDSVGKSLSEESFKQWEGLIELISLGSTPAGGLEFLHKYRDFKKSLQSVHDGKSKEAAQKAAESLVLLMKNPSTPQRFWLPILYDSLRLLNWQGKPLFNVTQTHLLLNKLQELSMATLRPDFVASDMPSQALGSVRQALAVNLGRAILEE